MTLLSASAPGAISMSNIGKLEISCSQRPALSRSRIALLHIKSHPFHHKRSVSFSQKLQCDALIFAASLNARCAAEQTQTVQRQSITITNAPIQSKDKSPELDDGGTGFPPRDDDGGGGGGGGGGPYWSGGFFFFGLLAFLGLLKDQESEGPYSDSNRR